MNSFKYVVQIVMSENNVPKESKESHLGKQVNFSSSYILFVGPNHTGEFVQFTKSKKAENKRSRLYPSKTGHFKGV